VVAGRKIVLLVAWLAWSRYRVVIALRDRTAPSVFAGLDRIFRIIGGAPTYLLTGRKSSKPGCRWHGSPSNRSASWSGPTAPMTPWAKPSPRSCAPNSLLVSESRWRA
jgi:hypothetical protein